MHLPPFKRHFLHFVLLDVLLLRKNNDQLTNMEKFSTCDSQDNPQWKAGKHLPEPLAQIEPDVTLECPNAIRKEKKILMGTPGHSLRSGCQLTSYIYGHIILLNLLKQPDHRPYRLVQKLHPPLFLHRGAHRSRSG